MDLNSARQFVLVRFLVAYLLLANATTSAFLVILVDCFGSWFPFGLEDVSLPYFWIPVVPCDEAGVDEHSHIMTVVTDILEEDSPSKERELQSLDVKIGIVCPPSVSTNGIGHKSAKDAIEIGKEEYGTLRRSGCS